MVAKDGAPLDLSAGYRTLAVLLPLFTVAAVAYGVRICTRIRPKYRLNAADYTITVAIAAEFISLLLTIVAVASGFGRPSRLLSADQLEIIGPTTFTVFIVALWASSFARISILCLLLQITQSRGWRVLLWSSIAIQGISLAASDISLLVQCHPIRMRWASVAGGSCLPTEHIWILAWVFSGLAMASDVLCAFLPPLLIWRLSRSRVEKTLLSILMGLGLLATLAGVFKILVLKSYDPMSENVVGDMMPAYMWIRIEEIVLIIASCAPLLKVPIENLLHRRLDLPRFAPRPGSLSTVHTEPGPCSGSKARFFWRPRESRALASNTRESSGTESSA